MAPSCQWLSLYLLLAVCRVYSEPSSPPFSPRRQLRFLLRGVGFLSARPQAEVAGRGGVSPGSRSSTWSGVQPACPVFFSRNVHRSVRNFGHVMHRPMAICSEFPSGNPAWCPLARFSRNLAVPNLLLPPEELREPSLGAVSRSYSIRFKLPICSLFPLQYDSDQQ